MAMPLSGSLGIKSCPGGTCTSIAQAVNGNITGNKSLITLSVGVGKPAPHCMLEFYGYVTAPTYPTVTISLVPTPIICATVQCICGVLTTSNAMPSNNCYFPYYCWSMCASNASISDACVKVVCNGAAIYQCSVCGKIFDCSGIWTTAARKVDYNDTINIITCASNNTVDSAVFSRIRVSSITQCVGTYCLGSPDSQASVLGGEIT